MQAMVPEGCNETHIHGEAIVHLQVTDADYNLLASAPFAIAVTKDKAEGDWAG